MYNLSSDDASKGQTVLIVKAVMTGFNGGCINLRVAALFGSSVKGDQTRQIRAKECIQVDRKYKQAQEVKGRRQ